MIRVLDYSGLSVALGVLLAGCSGAGGGAASGKPADWAADACKTFSREAASKVAGFSVAKTESSGQTGTDQVLVSNCTYSSADGATNFGLLLRQDKSDGQPVDEQIAGLTSHPDVTGPSEAVAMPSGKAIWATKLRTLSYVPAAGRMIVVTPPGAISFGRTAAPAGDLRARAIAIAIAVEGS